MTDTRALANYGRATIHPDSDVVAGSIGTWTLTYWVGRHGIDDGGHIKVAWRDSSDWRRPQFHDPGSPEFATVSTTGAAALEVSFDNHGYVRPWRPCLTITVYDGALAEGDTVTVVYGDTGSGSPGSMSQTFVEDSFEFRVAVDCFGTGRYVELADSPSVRVVSDEPHRLVVTTPSEAVVGEPTWVSVKVEDRWGNPTDRFTGTVSLASSDGKAVLPEAYRFTRRDGGIHRFDGVVFRTSGVSYVNCAISERDLKAVSNPILVHTKRPDLRLYWGDLHGQTESTIGTGTLDQYFRFARDASALDFASHVGNDFQISKEHYQDTQRAVKEYHVPGRFVTFLGYEWSGNTPAGGDHNVYFLHDDQPIHRSSHAQVDDRSDEETDRYPVSKLCDMFRGRDDVLVIPHIGGRRANLGFHDPSLTPFIEITSVHGHFEWFAHEAIKRGLKVGFVGGTDDHTCRPGGARPTSMVLSVNGGIMGVYARDLTREALWEAFRKRHVYASTGRRIILKVTCGDAMMGDQISLSGPATLDVQVIGTSSLESVEVLRGSDVVYSHPIVDRSKAMYGTLRVMWTGARVGTRRRNTDWSGSLSLDRGRILSAEERAFDLPWDGITRRTDRQVSWRSTTSGDIDGLLLRVDAPDDAVATFDTKPARFSFRPSQLDTPLVIEAGGLGQRVEISRVPPQELPVSVSFSFTDHEVGPGTDCYWVRVVQSDGEKAWSSPLFIERLK